MWPDAYGWGADRMGSMLNPIRARVAELQFISLGSTPSWALDKVVSILTAPSLIRPRLRSDQDSWRQLPDQRQGQP